MPYSFNLAGINEISEILRLNVSGALFSGKDFTLLVYPPDSQDWAFLDEKFPEVPPVGLRCIMRTSIQLPAMESCDDKLEKIRKGLVERGKKITFTSDEPVINAVMRNVYNIDYQRLIRQPKQDKTQEANKFFLIFPKERRAEHDLIVQFLDANDAAEVYSYDEDNNDGTWEYFYRHVKDGVIIVSIHGHELVLILTSTRRIRLSGDSITSPTWQSSCGTTQMFGVLLCGKQKGSQNLI